jgi:hypothetical protein
MLTPRHVNVGSWIARSNAPISNGGRPTGEALRFLIEPLVSSGYGWYLAVLVVAAIAVVAWAAGRSRNGDR